MADTNEVQTEEITTTEANEAVSATQPADLDAYLGSLDEDTRTMVEGLRTQWHEGQVTGLKSALDKERTAAGEATKALRELAKTADTETAAKLEALATEKDAQLDDARKENTFYREAAVAGVSAEKLARAWLLCKNADYFDKKGNPDIAAMKSDVPELFAVPQVIKTQTNAGAGTRQEAAVVEVDPLRAAIDAKRGIVK